MNLLNLRLRSILLLGFLMVRILALSQDLEESNFIRYTRLQGLSNNYVSGIVQDSTGYLWIATHKGLNRFDGKTFQTIFKSSHNSPLPDNLVVSMNHQCNKEIIGATRAGAFAFNPVTGQFKQFIVNCDSTIYFWTNHALDVVRDDLNNYIVSTKTGLYVFNFDGKLIRRYDHHIVPDVGREELIFGGWVNTLPNGTTMQQNGLLGSLYDPVTNKIDTQYIAKREGLKKCITDDGGNMKPSWSGKFGEIFIINKEKNSVDVADIASAGCNVNIMPFSVSNELGWSSALTLLDDSTLVLTSKTSGFYTFHYNHKTRQITSDGRKYFEGNVCTSIFKDRENRIWIGTADGLYKQNLHNSFFTVNDLSLQAPYLLDHEIKSVYVEDSSIYLGLQNEGGVIILDKRSGRIDASIQFLPKESYNNTVTNIFPYHKDTLWIGTNAGIVWLNKRNHHYGRVAAPPHLDWIQSINSNCFFQDSKKNVWVAFGKLNSLVRYDRATHTFVEISPSYNPLLKVTYIFSMAEDLDGNIWLAGDGLCRWNLKKQMIDTLIPYPKVSRLLRNYMFILDRDSKNNLWLSSFDNEIIQYNCTTNSMFLRQEENNLIDGNTITSSPIIGDHIWMGTDNGISAFDIDDYSVRQFTYADGLPSVAITSIRKGSFYDPLSNRYYLAARHRLISLVPDPKASKKISPTLFIEKINSRDSMIVPAADPIRLPYRMNNMTIIFNTINFTDPEENRFAWRSTTGSDTGWNELNDQTRITLTNLSGGWHHIQVKLYSANNRWPQKVRGIDFYIHPPFWKDIWFILAMAIIVAAVIFLIYKTRINSVRRKEREKARVQQLIAEEYKSRLELEQIINYFASSLKDKANIDDVLWDVTQNLISRLGYSDCIIYLWNRDRTKMLQKAAYGPKGSPAAIAMNEFTVAPGEGLVGHVMKTHQPIIVGDTRRDKRYRVDDMPRLSEICVPILHNYELMGVIDSEHHNANYFCERDLKILTTIATMVANKIKQIESEHFLQIKQREIASINQQLAEAQISALQTQMNPHFIFNCLNSIKGMILNNEQGKASRYLSKFATMIRITLNQSKEIFTTLYENIEHLENYLVMEKLRFDDSFSFRIIVDDDIDKEETLIPTLMIQPLAENAIWHGLMSKQGEKHLKIRFSKIGEMITCNIEDNGIGVSRSEELKKTNKSAHIAVGLNNIRNRIKIMNEKYDTGCTLEIHDLKESKKGNPGTCAVLRFKIITNKIYI